jgi:mycoredoxin
LAGPADTTAPPGQTVKEEPQVADSCHDKPYRPADTQSGGVPTVTASVEVPSPLVIYSTTWCGYCRTLKRQLVDEGIAFTEVNIEDTPGAAEFVMGINRGDQTVPTVLFPDGRTLTNPRLSAVLAQLRATDS